MQFIPPPYTPPELAREQYQRTLHSYNQEIHARLKTAFDELFSQPIDATIAVIGSDGRFEKSPASPIELCMYHSDSNPEKAITAISTFIRKPGKAVFLQELDVKDVTHSGVNYYQDDPARAFPTRITDSTTVYGPECHLNAAKERLVYEWAGTDGRHILDRVSNKAREARKIIEKNGEGMYRGTIVRHFDFDLATSTYDPARYHLSFKAGPLRLVQYSISRGLIKYARKGIEETEHTKETVLHMPSNTAERLAFLANTGFFNLSTSDAATLGDHYNFFNMLYHASENAFLAGNSESRIQNTSLAKERMKDLAKLAERLE